ncbi:hypothetical protein EVAR_68735_1 [Eumeta japonica]|uniref:Uncharacterized protein n=1 Tax=Eumeta variegata TaxID=151549 RepID=A0A4C2AC00_EUMVA|nr:hypothetical protein EVAR_68735_1 [Eumeta japonica]
MTRTQSRDVSFELPTNWSETGGRAGRKSEGRTAGARAAATAPPQYNDRSIVTSRQRKRKKNAHLGKGMLVKRVTITRMRDCRRTRRPATLAARVRLFGAALLKFKRRERSTDHILNLTPKSADLRPRGPIEVCNTISGFFSFPITSSMRLSAVDTITPPPLPLVAIRLPSGGTLIIMTGRI